MAVLFVTSRCLSLFSLFQALILLKAQSFLYSNQPRFHSINGHFFIISAENRNITLQTSGDGHVNFNGENLQQIVRKAKNVDRYFDEFKMNELPDIKEKLNRYSEFLEGPNGLVLKFAKIEGSVNSSSLSGQINGSPKSVSTTVSNLERSVKKLSKDVRRLKNLLTVNECASNPCRNGGTCIDLFNGFQCQCPDQWEGTLCDADVDECSTLSNTHLACQNGGSCVNKPGYYECLCSPGFFGVHCSESSNSCNYRPDEMCGHGICVNHKTGFKCICDEGWTTDGRSPACVVDVDECLTHFSCSKSPPVQCFNTPGSYRCGSCPPGYSGNGHYCSDIDECISSNGGCSQNPLVSCYNLMGSSFCGACPAGYSGDGKTCRYLGGPCYVNNGGCHPKAHCVQNTAISENFVQCNCPPNYAGSGFGPDGCTPTSVATTNYIACPSSFCNNHGSCTYQGLSTDFKCSCYAGYIGSTCEISNDPCSPNPCLNGGNCTSVTSDSEQFKCECPSGFIGHFCQMEREVCNGVFRTLSGSLSFPETPNTSYPHDSNCAWIIQTNISLVLSVSFEYFVLESSLDCKIDWLQINDGPDTTHNLIGRFCGSVKPKNFTSSSNSLHVWFRSDSTNSLAGFKLTWTSTQPECGGSIVQRTHGTINSPGSPRRYPINRDCYWFIEVYKGYKIIFTFYSFMIGTDTNCTHDYLEIYSGSNNEEVLARLCGSNNPDPIYSSLSTATLYFHSDNFTSTDEVGFQASFTAVRSCGGILSALSGVITPPQNVDKPDTYLHDTICEWTILLPPKERVILNFLTLDIEQSDNCTYDYLEIFDGPNYESPLLGRFCGSEESVSPIVTSTNQVSIRFTTDLTQSKSGFRIKYSLFCGGEFSAPTGHFNSPLFPKTYPNEKRCTYLLSQPPGKAIEVKFVEFEIESTENACDLDYLKAYDGENENATLIGTYCSLNRPGTIISQFNFLYFVFESDISVVKKGFYATYSAINIACGGILKANSSTFTSPKHPNKYPVNQKCQWVISAPPGYFIQLTWLEFSLESHVSCRHDYVEVYDNSSQVTQVERFCGSKLPPPITSMGSVMTIKFVSDNSVAMDGFSANYVMHDGSKMCGGNFFSTTGFIRSPNFPRNYPNNRNCVWTITVPAGQQIKLHFKNFTLESNKACRYDFLEIRQGGYETSPLIGKYCGSETPPSIISHSNQLYLKFFTDSVTTFKGFNLYWDGTSTGCGGVLTSSTGWIISPNHPNINAVCAWKISVNKGSIIQLSIMDLDVFSTPFMNCYSSQITIYDGKDEKSPILGEFCEDRMHAALKSTGNEIFIKFRQKKNTYSERGFHLQYISICNTTLTGYTGVIESPNFPNPNSVDTNCMWEIAVPLGNKINISFSHFNLNEKVMKSLLPSYGLAPYSYISRISLWRRTKTFQGCSNFLEISESDRISASSSNVSLGKFCGDTLPKMISSTKNHIFIHFQSNEILIGKGFRLEWVMHGCGGIFSNHPYGEFSTPNYPNSYPPRIQCDWYFITDWDKQVEISIPNIDITDGGTTCSSDSLTIYSGGDTRAPVLTKVCHFQNTTTVRSHGNRALVSFKSNTSVSGRGFEGSFTTIKADCGGDFVGMSGTILTPNYPKNYGKNEECQWLIEVKENHLVNFTFSDFDVGVGRLNENCSNSYVDVFDGSNTNAPLLYKLCGNTLPKPIISSSNKLLLRLRAREPPTKGFIGNYAIACGAVIETDESGIISSEADVLNFSPSNICTWIIKAKNPESKITFTVTHLNIPKLRTASLNSSDEVNSLIIYDGDDTNSSIIQELRSTSIAPSVISSGPFITVSLRLSDPDSFFSKHLVRFSGYYSVRSMVCGGDLKSEQGTISSPNYPNGYPKNTDCVWYLSVSAGNKIQIAFSDFNLLENENCHEDYVEIREGSVGGKLLSLNCGDLKPNLITATGGLWIKFHSGELADTTGKGFTADFAIVTSNELTGPSGAITSPLYPLPYTTEKTFSWRILVRDQQSIMISFNDFYFDEEFEENMIRTDCLNGLQIYDGFDKTAPLLHDFCGVTTPKPVISSTNIIFIIFHCSSLTKGVYFSLEWSEVPQKLDPGKESSNSSTGCNQSVYLTETISSNATTYALTSGLDKKYSDCKWLLRCDKGSHIVLKFVKVFFHDDDFFFCKVKDNGVNIFEGTRFDEWHYVSTLCSSNTTGTVIEGTNLMKLEISLEALYSFDQTSLEVKASLVCGGIFDDPNGVIEVREKTQMKLDGSKDFLTGQFCEWTVIVRLGHTIRFSNLEFRQFSTSKSSMLLDCEKAYVEIRNGQDSEYPYLGNGKYCNSTISPIPETSGNKAYVKFYVTRRNHMGFRLMYEEVSVDCNREYILSDSLKSLNISSPQYPNAPPPHTQCIWKFTAPSHESLQVSFPEEFDFKYSINCKKDFIELRDGLTEISPKLGRFCSSYRIPSSLFTTGNQLFIKYFTDIPNPGNGFLATIDIATCGGTYRVLPYSTDRIVSPNFPNSYPSNIVCNYTLIAKLSDYLSFTFTSVNLYSSTSFNNFAKNTSCPEDKIDTVIVYEIDAITSQKTELARACHRHIPPPFLSTTNKVLVTFTSKNILPSHQSDDNSKGFALNYTSERTPCGGIINTPYGSISSPNYPLKPRARISCIWKINGPPGRRITVYIVKANFMPLNSTVKNQRYWDETLTLSNGYTDPIVSLTDPQISGKKIESSSNVMSIRYRSSSKDGFSRGFLLNFTSTEPAVCGGVLNESGMISSPNTSGTGFSCEWKRDNFQLKGKTFVMNVTGITGSDEGSGDCDSNNMVSIAGQYSFKTYELCSNVSQTAIIRTPSTASLTIKAVSSAMSREKIGQIEPNFTVNYRTTNCGGVFYPPYFNVSSPNFPNPYDDESDCAWILLFSGDRKLAFHLIDLDPDCEINFLRVYSGKSTQGLLLKEFCGPASNVEVHVSDNIFIEFHSSSNRNKRKGFLLIFSTEAHGTCGGALIGTSGVITTPNYPNLYPNSASCVWEIEVPPGFRVGLSFVDRYFLEYSTNCTNDFIQVNDYEGNENPVPFEVGFPPQRRFCGRNHPPPFNSTRQRMSLRFQSNSEKAGEGFQAQWNAFCGGIFTEETGTITSPNYPNPYQEVATCTYKIIAPGKIISLDFINFSLEKADSSGCSFHNLSVYSLSNTWGGTELKLRKVYCGDTVPPKQRYRSVVSLVLHSHYFVQTSGFLIKYKIIGCGGIIIDSPSTIALSHPDMENIGYCKWNITAPEGQVVLIWFRKLQLFDKEPCYGGLKLFDGLNTNNDSSMLAVICEKTSGHLPVFKSNTNKAAILYDGLSYKDLEFEATVLFTLGESKGCGGRVTLNETQRQTVIKFSPKEHIPLNCEWNIFTTEDSVIQLTIVSLDVGHNTNSSTNFSNCDLNRLAIFDGISNRNEDLIKYLCSNSPASLPLRSSGNSLSLKFSTNELSETKPKLEIKLEMVESLCGKSHLTGDRNKTAVLTSPGWPQPYPPNLRCVWFLKGASSPLDIHITELDIAESPQCIKDKLQIFTKNRNSYTFCDSKANLSSVSDIYPESVAKIIFTSSNSETAAVGPVIPRKHKGFRLTYQGVGCTRNYTRNYGQIQLRHRQENKQDCIIFIRSVEPGALISLYFTDFRFIGSDLDCSTHSVTIWGGRDTTQLLRTLCEIDSMPNPIFTNDSLIKIHIHLSHPVNVYLDITYVASTVGPGCGGYIYNSHGTLSSPFYPNAYRNDSICRWQIDVPPGNIIRLDFQAFNFGPSSTCSTNYLTIFEVSPDTNEEIFFRRFCAQDDIAILLSSSNKIIIESRINGNKVGPGWLLDFKAVEKDSANNSPSFYDPDEFDFYGE